MGACASCSSAVPEGSRFCPSCGSAVEISSENMTRTSAPAATPTSGAPLEGRHDLVTIIAQDLGDDDANGLFIVYDENAFHFEFLSDR